MVMKQCVSTINTISMISLNVNVLLLPLILIHLVQCYLQLMKIIAVLYKVLPQRQFVDGCAWSYLGELVGSLSLTS